jgi:hypothetical protein
MQEGCSEFEAHLSERAQSGWMLLQRYSAWSLQKHRFSTQYFLRE